MSTRAKPATSPAAVASDKSSQNMVSLGSKVDSLSTKDPRTAAASGNPNFPVRIQRKRTKGWRMPDGAVYVGRPTPYGNPFTVMNGHRQGWLVWDDRDRLGFVTFNTSGGFVASFPTRAEAHRHAVKLYKRHIFRQIDLTLLRGKDLACWCPLDLACHVDVLLQIANPRPRKNATK